MEMKEFFEPVLNFIKGFQKKDKEPASKQAAKDRLKLVLMQDRASVSPDFFEMMKQEIIDVIKKYIEIDEESLEVELTRGLEAGLDGPALYANIPIKNVKPVAPKSEENSALSEEEADQLADAILTNIESVANIENDEANNEASSEVSNEASSESSDETSNEANSDAGDSGDNKEREDNVATVNPNHVSDASNESKSEPMEVATEKTPGEIAEEIMAAQKKSANRRKAVPSAKSTTAKRTTSTKSGTKKKKTEQED